jgi:hypothetical protein
MAKSQKEEMVSKGNVLADGELTGHAHRVTVAVMERTEDAVRVFVGPTTVTHEEHKPITLPARKWNSVQVTEFDHIANMERIVRD